MLNQQHLRVSNASGEDAEGRPYYDVHFKVEGKTVALDDADEVAWSGVSTQLALADAETGSLSQPAATATYRQGDEDVIVPEEAYELVVGCVEASGGTETFHEKTEGWQTGDRACIAVKGAGMVRFTMNSDDPHVIARDVPVIAADDAHSFAAGAGVEVSLDQDSFTYDGTAHEPSVSARAGEVELVRGTDFKVAYVANVAAGTSQVQVRGIGAYAGERAIDFEIQKLDLAQCDIKVADRPYTGSQVRPGAADVKVSYQGNDIPAALTSGDEELLQWIVDESGFGSNVNAGDKAGTFA